MNLDTADDDNLLHPSPREIVVRQSSVSLRTRRLCVASFALLCVFGFFGLLTSTTERRGRSHSDRDPSQIARPTHTESLLESKAEDDASASIFCGLIEQNLDYKGVHLYDAQDAATVEDCCAKCQDEPKCRIWTLTDQHLCKLKGAVPGSRYMHDLTSVTSRKMGYVSGLPFQMLKQGTIFCFALMRPGTYEQDLIAMQRQRRVSIFACDEYGVYSSKEIVVDRGVKTSVVESDLKCELGGEFKTALNTDIFLAVWDKVFKDARYKFHDWTVKADPDTVFFPERLRVAVQFHADDGDGIYLNNCQYGLHGPLEVLSRRAVDAWRHGVDRCVKHFNDMCSGPCAWGEDMFMDQCLEKVLKVKRADDWNLLSEPHCDSVDWQDCRNGRVAFHPFKKKAAYEACLEDGNFGVLPRPVRQEASETGKQDWK